MKKTEQHQPKSKSEAVLVAVITTCGLVLVAIIGVVGQKCPSTSESNSNNANKDISVSKIEDKKVPEQPSEFDVSVYVKGIQERPESFKIKVNKIAEELDTKPNYLMAVMSYDTGGTFDPSHKWPGREAFGLIPFSEPTATYVLGTSLHALAKMSAEEQLDYVKKYFAQFKGRLETIEDTYLAVHIKEAIGKEKEHVLFADKDTGYIDNPKLDRNNDGKITVDEFTYPVQKIYKKISESNLSSPPGR